MSSVKNVWSISYPSGYAFRPNCDFQIMYQNIGARVDVIINSVQNNGIHSNFVNGFYEINKLAIKYTGEPFKTCNFINIIMTITNNDNKDIKYSICNRFDTAINGADGHSANGLPGYKGWRGKNDDKYIDFYFNNSYKVTSASSSHFNSYGSPFAKSAPYNELNTDFSSSGLTINWEDRIIGPGEVQEIRYSIGYGDYITGYTFNLYTNTSMSHPPGSEANVSISFTDSFFGDKITITRIIDDKSRTQIYDEIDNGNLLKFDDKFLVPSKIGYHDVKYIVTNNASIPIEKNVTILVNTPPTLILIDHLFKLYKSNEEVLINVTIYDDTYVTFHILIDSNEILSERVECQAQNINQTFKIQIPNGNLNSKHVISLLCIDEFGEVSEKISQEYVLNTPVPPEFKINNSFSYIQTPLSVVNISGEVRYMNGQNIACFSSMISNKYMETYSCDYINSEWKPFAFERQIPIVLGGIYKLVIEAVDGNYRKWNAYEQYFAIAIIPLKTCPIYGCHIPYMHLALYVIINQN